MEQIISKEELEELKKIKGEVRKMSFKTTAEFILKEKGEEGLKKLENTMANLGYPIKHETIKPMDFYPLWADAAKLLIIKRLFNFDDKKFQEMGEFEAKISLIMRIFLQYFISLKRAIKEGPRLWKRYFSVGDLKVIEFNTEDKYAIFRLENFYHHPLSCQTHKGYFPTIFQMIIKSKVTCQETKCVHRGDKFHEFLLKWQ